MPTNAGLCTVLVDLISVDDGSAADKDAAFLAFKAAR